MSNLAESDSVPLAPAVSGQETVKDLVAGAAGGVAQVLIGRWTLAETDIML